MKRKIFVLASAFVITASACNSGNDSSSQKDSANTLHDTLPANGPGDSLPVDSNPPDATKIDSGNRQPN
jgi:hypothetical protein